MDAKFNLQKSNAIMESLLTILFACVATQFYGHSLKKDINGRK